LMEITKRPDWMRELEQRGFAIVPDVLSPKVVEGLLLDRGVTPETDQRTNGTAAPESAHDLESTFFFVVNGFFSRLV